MRGPAGRAAGYEITLGCDDAVARRVLVTATARIDESGSTPAWCAYFAISPSAKGRGGAVEMNQQLQAARGKLGQWRWRPETPTQPRASSWLT